MYAARTFAFAVSALVLSSTALAETGAVLLDAAGCCVALESTEPLTPADPLGDDRVIVGAIERGSGFDIQFSLDKTAAADMDFVNALNAGAGIWEQYIQDPVVVTIEVTLGDMTSGSVRLRYERYQTDYVTLRDAMAADAQTFEADLLNALPTERMEWTTWFDNYDTDDDDKSNDFFGSMETTQAAARALGLFTDPGADACLDFDNVDFTLDTNPSDGVPAGHIDVVWTTAHMIGHILGFQSDTDRQVLSIQTKFPTSLDMFRFQYLGAPNPASLADFSTFTRDTAIGAPAIFDVVGAIHGLPSSQFRFSTGTFIGGDGRPANHWKDDAFSSITTIGLMDPTYDFSKVLPSYVAFSDLMAMSVMGWDIDLGCLPADINNDGVISALDIAELLSRWGPEPSVSDVTGDGVVDALDIATLLSYWGPCFQTLAVDSESE